MPKPKVAAIIQARMGSSRLPGKVLQPLVGKPVLWHIIHRLRKCRTVDMIAIATSDRPCDDALAEFATREGVFITRGSEDNVLLRYAEAARELDPDIIIRVTGDAPFIDPGTLDRLVLTLVQESADYCTGEPDVHTIHEGFVPFTRHALNRLLAEAAEDPVAIEHVTAYISEHPEKFNIAYISIPAEHHFEGARMSVDTPADMRFIEALYRHLDVPAGEADMAEVVQTLKNHPELLEINAHIYQKKATDRSLSILVRCDSDGGTGFGHVTRCLALADELRERHGCGVAFAMITGPKGKRLVKDAGFPVLEPSGEQDEASWLKACISSRKPDILVLDIRSDLAPEAVRAWRSSNLFVVTLDDPSDRRQEADLAFYPPVPQVLELDWERFTGEKYTGWEWVVLKRTFGVEKPVCKKDSSPHILVSMGGSDPAGLTLTALRELDGTEGNFSTTVVLGPDFAHDAELDSFLAGAGRSYRLKQNVQNMAQLISRCHLAIISFGVTAYEIAALGVPGIYFCLSDDHARSAEAFVRAGIGFSLGQYAKTPEGALADRVLHLLHDKSILAEMSRRTQNLVDGRGAERIANLLISNFKSQ